MQNLQLSSETKPKVSFAHRTEDSSSPPLATLPLHPALSGPHYLRLPDVGCRCKWASWRIHGWVPPAVPWWCLAGMLYVKGRYLMQSLYRELMESFNIQAEFPTFSFPKSATLWFNICWVVINST